MRTYFLGKNSEDHETFDKNVLKTFTKNKAFKTRHKLKAHTSKIVSSFKPPAMSCMLVKEFRVSTMYKYGIQYEIANPFINCTIHIHM